MNILVFNCGSTSLKAEVINSESAKRLLELTVERILTQPQIIFDDNPTITCDKIGHEAVLNHAFPLLLDKLKDTALAAIGHRVVHGGNDFKEAVIINETVEKRIGELSDLAPLHNPINLVAIQVSKKYFDSIPHIAVFDTAFHQTLPRRSQYYAISKKLADQHQIRRYGFHGTSHEYVAKEAAQFLKQDYRSLRLITCHLGGGCSIAAIEFGRSIETSMGMTPLEGLVMGTRSGDIDPGVLFYLSKKENLSIEDLDKKLNKESGLLGLTGNSDMRDIIEKAAEGDEDSRLALHVFNHRVKKYIGAYMVVMGGVDAIVFTGGIGENSAVVRQSITQGLAFSGAILNEDLNRNIQLDRKNRAAIFSMAHSRVRLLAVKTDEQYSIAKQTAKLVAKENEVNTVPQIPIAISARHVHLTQEVVEQLFGEGYELTAKKWLSQPGQFAANETVSIVGPKNTLERVRVLGPTRSLNQIEISRTDEYFLGIDAPIRASGNIANTPGATLIGPAGKVTLKEGVICALRHIHMTPEDAEIFGVKDKDVVELEVAGDSGRKLTFGDVLIRVSPKYKLEMHIDTDEGNAAEIRSGATGVLTDTDSNATLRKRRM